MPLTIAHETFEIVPLSPADQETYRAYCGKIARSIESPAETFIREQCRNLSREERQDALAAWMARPDWDEPAESAILRAARQPAAVAALCRRVLRPAKTQAQWFAILGDDAEKVYGDLLAAMRPPSDEEIKNRNDALRAAINGALRKANEDPAPGAANATEETCQHSSET